MASQSDLQRVAVNLKMARQVAQLTQQQLARRAGVDVALISRLERGGRVRPSYASIVKIARALHLAPDELFPVPLPPALSPDAA